MQAIIRALVLDRRHRVLCDADGAAPKAPVAWPERPLVALRAFAAERLGLALGSPAGTCVPKDARGPRDFVFMIDTVAPPSGFAWRPLAEATANDWVWCTYVELMLGGWEPPSRELDVFAFGGGGELASRLVHLVTCGSKRATAMWLRALEANGQTRPVPGMISIVTDAHGFPRCVIRTEETIELPFGQVNAELAALEGESDLTLESWRDDHRWYFGGEAEKYALSFDDNAPILMERFRVLHVIGRRDEA